MSGAERRISRPESWPQADRWLWDAAVKDRGPFDSGPASRWRPASRRAALGGYGRWMGWLAAHEPPALALEPGARVTTERVEAFSRGLTATMTFGGAAEYVRRL